MNSLRNTDSFQVPSGGSGPIYVVGLVKVNDVLAAITDDGTLMKFDAGKLGVGPLSKHKIDSLRILQNYEGSVIAAAGHGEACLIDLRKPSLKPVVRISHPAIGVQALSCSRVSSTLATGTECENHVSTVFIWDIRAPTAPKGTYNEIHSDDITELRFHPTHENQLLSGSMDGLVNVIDTTISDEDEAVLSAFNPNASVHRAGWLSDTELFALSHDEKLTIYSTESDSDQDLADLRPRLNCQYVANIIPGTQSSHAVIGAGSVDRASFTISPLKRNKRPLEWQVDLSSTMDLPDAHGNEVVRSFVKDDRAVFTAGEDGNVKAWTEMS